MGYMKEKQRIEKKIVKIRWIYFALSLVLVAVLCVLAVFFSPNEWKYHIALPSVEFCKQGELRVSFLNVGQGDATLVRFPDGKTMLVDGGNETQKSELSLMRYLNAAEIERIDYLVLTHPDADHCGGLGVVAETKEIGTAYLPSNVQIEKGGAYEEYLSALEKNGCAVAKADRTLRIVSTDPAYPYSVVGLYPYASGIDQTDGEEYESNERSCVLLIEYNGVEILISGDAPAEAEESIMHDYSLGMLAVGNGNLNSVEILKVAHHGSNNATTQKWINFLHLQTAVISVGEGNAYGHPTAETLARLSAGAVQTYRTDLHGHIVAVVSGNGTYEMKVES